MVRKLNLNKSIKKKRRKKSDEEFIENIKKKKKSEQLQVYVPEVVGNDLELSKEAFKDIKRRVDTKRLIVVDTVYSKLQLIMSQLDEKKVKELSAQGLIVSTSALLQSLGEFLSKDIAVVEIGEEYKDVPKTYEELIAKRNKLAKRVSEIIKITEIKPKKIKKNKNK